MKVNRCTRTILKVNVAVYIAVSLLLSWLFTLFMHGEPPDIDPGIPLDTAFDKVFFGVFIVPAFETLLFQVLIIDVAKYLIKRARWHFFVSVPLSSVLFALTHCYSVAYFIFALFGGFLLAFTYFIFRYRKESPLVVVFLVHALWNLLNFIAEGLLSG